MSRLGILAVVHFKRIERPDVLCATAQAQIICRYDA